MLLEQAGLAFESKEGDLVLGQTCWREQGDYEIHAGWMDGWEPASFTT